MVTKNIYEKVLTDNATKNVIEYYGLSTDEKPTDAENGSAFLEMDTGTVYLYDKDGETWRAV